MSYSTTTISKALSELNHHWFLPSIQRPFVWKPDQIRALFDSILKGLPISSFLLWDMEKDTASTWQSYKFIENFKHGDVHNIRIDLSGRAATFVLDGQQRLTSLLVGFYGSYTTKAKNARRDNLDAWTQRSLYLNLLKCPEELTSDELDSDIAITYGLDFFETDPRTTPDELWFRISRLKPLKTDDDFATLHAEIMEQLPAGATRQDRRIVENNLERIWETYSRAHLISYFTEKQQSLDRVLNIFIRANDAGTKLSKSDLLMTMVTSKWQTYKAREEILGFVDHLNQGLGRPNKITKDFVLKACLVLGGMEVAYKVDNFTNYNLDQMERAWPETKQSLINTFELINAYGIDKDTLSSTNALLPIAYYLHRTGQDLKGTTELEGQQRKRVMQWLLGALINSAFSGTSDNAISACRGTLKDHLRNSRDFPMLELVQALAKQGRLATFTSENIRRLLNQKYGERHIFLALSLLYEIGAFNKGTTEIDHIIPQSSVDKKALQAAGHSEMRIKEIIEASQKIGNLQLLLARENNEKRDQPFSHWVETRDEDFLKRHHLPEDRSLWKVENLPEFVDARERLIEQWIKNISPAIY